ncbi:MAG TPA: phytanoyl-CoA dioxygenase family protein [Fimbriimonas sp.]
MAASDRVLTSGGFALDLSPDRFGWLVDSSGIAGDFDALRERMDRDGYLFLPGYLDREEVVGVRRSICEALGREGLLDPSEPVESAIAREGLEMYFRPDIANSNEALRSLIYGERIMEFYSGLLGGEVRHYDYTWMRAIAPGKGTSPHMDIVYMGRGTSRLYTAWVPFGDIPLEVGGLVVLENSCQYDPLKSTYARTDVDVVCLNDGDRIQPQSYGYHGFGAITDNPVALRDEIGGRWLTAERFRMGDLLTFGMHTVHASLDNASREIRLSSDSRYQLASEPIDERWIGEHPIGHGEKARIGMIC